MHTKSPQFPEGLTRARGGPAQKAVQLQLREGVLSDHQQTKQPRVPATVSLPTDKIQGAAPFAFAHRVKVVSSMSGPQSPWLFLEDEAVRYEDGVKNCWSSDLTG